MKQRAALVRKSDGVVFNVIVVDDAKEYTPPPEADLVLIAEEDSARVSLGATKLVSGKFESLAPASEEPALEKSTEA